MKTVRFFAFLVVVVALLGWNRVSATSLGDSCRFIDHIVELVAPQVSEKDAVWLAAFREEWTSNRFCAEDTMAFRGLAGKMEDKGLASHPECFVAMARAFEARHATSVMVNFPIKEFFESGCFVVDQLPAADVERHFRLLEEMIATGKVNGY